MPFTDNSFDLILCRAAFKNFSEPVDALNEMFRTLKAGGRAIIMDLSKDVSSKEVAAYVERMDLGWFDFLLTKLIFRFILIPRAYSIDQFAQMVSHSKFGRSEIIKIPMGNQRRLDRLPSTTIRSYPTCYLSVSSTAELTQNDLTRPKYNQVTSTAQIGSVSHSPLY
jgi:SAM-dependent methyltransferase